ncbi:MAG: DUF1724 domain-containing protein, partial [Methanobrevibacter sp.]|nr:DUF1724 domain-containing protein [Methanobrevibacter sp.]
EDTTLNLIATKTVLKSIKNNNYDEYLLKINKTKNIRIWELSEEVKLFLTVCDNFLSFNLFFKDGYYDDSVSIMDNSAEGLLWGIELFDYYKEKGKLIDIEEYFS